MAETMLTCNDIAARLRMNVAYVRRAFVPKMRHVRVGRTMFVFESAFREWLREREVSPRGGQQQQQQQTNTQRSKR